MSLFENLAKKCREARGDSPTLSENTGKPKNHGMSLFEKVAADRRKLQLVDEATRMSTAESVRDKLLGINQPAGKVEKVVADKKPDIIIEKVDNQFNVRFENQSDILLICNTEEEAINEGKAAAERLGANFAGVKESNIPDPDEYRKLTYKVGEIVSVPVGGEQAVTKGGKQWSDAEILDISKDNRSLKLRIKDTGEERWINRFARKAKKLTKNEDDTTPDTCDVCGRKLKKGEEFQEYIGDKLCPDCAEKAAEHEKKIQSGEKFESKVNEQMINRSDIKVEWKDDGLYLSVETPEYKYGQFYSTANQKRGSKNFVSGVKEAKDRFIVFYSKFDESKVNEDEFGDKSAREPDYEDIIKDPKPESEIESKPKLKPKEKTDADEKPEDTPVEKKCVGQSEDNYYYMVATDDDDLQLVDQEGTKVYSAKEKSLDVKDLRGFIAAVIKDVEIDSVTRDIVMDYIIPEEEKPEEEEEPESEDEEESKPKSKKGETEEKPEVEPPPHPAEIEKETKESKIDEDAGKGNPMGPRDTIRVDDIIEIRNLENTKTIVPASKVVESGTMIGDVDTEFHKVKTEKGGDKWYEAEGYTLVRMNKASKVSEGKEIRGERDGTGPYKDSAQRSIHGDKGVRKMEGEECPKSTPDDVNNIPTEPEEDDIVWKSNGEVVSGGKVIGDAVKYDDFLDLVKEWANTNKFYPDVWHEDDHGGLNLITAEVHLTEGKSLGESKINEGTGHNYDEYITKKKREFGEKFDDSDLEKKFKPYFESGERIKVKFSGGEVKTGTVGVTTGWKPAFILMLTSRSTGPTWLLKDDDEINESKILTEMKVSDGTNEFDVQIFDDGTMDTVIDINGREFRFDSEFASMWRDSEGTLSEEGLREIAMLALSSMELEEYEDLVKQGAEEENPYNLHGEELKRTEDQAKRGEGQFKPRNEPKVNEGGIGSYCKVGDKVVFDVSVTTDIFSPKGDGKWKRLKGKTRRINVGETGEVVGEIDVTDEYIVKMDVDGKFVGVADWELKKVDESKVNERIDLIEDSGYELAETYEGYVILKAADTDELSDWKEVTKEVAESSDYAIDIDNKFYVYSGQMKESKIKEGKIDKVYVVIEPFDDSTAGDLVWGGTLESLRNQLRGGFDKELLDGKFNIVGMYTEQEEAMGEAKRLLGLKKNENISKINKTTIKESRDLIDPSRGVDLLKKLLKR